MASNMEQLGMVIVDEMLRVSKAGRSLVFDFGTIGAALELKPDLLPGPVPNGAYTICRTVSGEEIGETENGIKVRSKPLEAEDRVLILCHGTEYIVVDVLAS